MNLDPRTTALVMIDLQKGILARAMAPHATADVLARAVALAGRFRSAGAPVVWLRVGWSPDFGDMLRQPTDVPPPVPPGGYPADFAELPEGLVQPTDLVVTKRQWGAFYGTELDLQLRRRGVRTVVLGGITTNFGVESTARAAWEHGYAVVVAEDATTSLSAEMHEFSVRNILPRIAVVSTSTGVAFTEG